MPRQPPNGSKATRISMRIDPQCKEVIARAARLGHTTFSTFMIENAYHAANALLADHNHLVMSQEEIDHFFKVLDNPPPKSIKAIRKLLSEPSILDG